MDGLAPKSEELIRKCISKIVQCILLSRVEVLSSETNKITKNFHLEIKESESIQRLIENRVFSSNGIKTLFFLDIHFDENNGLGFNTLIESWKFVFEPINHIDFSVELPKFHTNAIILIRTIYALLRNLPCYALFRNFSKNRSTTCSMKYQIRIADQLSITTPSFALSTPTKNFTFTSIPTPLGTMKLDVVYKENLSREISTSSQLGLESQFIIKDYNNNNFKHHTTKTQQQNIDNYNYNGFGGHSKQSPPSSFNSNSGNTHAPSSQPIPVRMHSYNDLQSLGGAGGTHSNNSSGSGGMSYGSSGMNRPSSYQPTSSNNLYDYQYQQQQQQQHHQHQQHNQYQQHQQQQHQQQFSSFDNRLYSNPIGIPPNNQNSGGFLSNSPPSSFPTSQPQYASGSPPFSSRTGGSPPFSSRTGGPVLPSPYNRETPPSNTKQVNFSLPSQLNPSSSSSSPTSGITIQNNSFNPHRNRSTSAPISIESNQPHQQHNNNNNTIVVVVVVVVMHHSIIHQTIHLDHHHPHRIEVHHSNMLVSHPLKNKQL